MARSERLLHKRGSVVRETDKAYLADLDTVMDQVWLPKSEVEYDGTDFIIPEWLANAKDIE